MVNRSLQPHQFLRAARQGVMLDVRTPAEFDRGHVPGAINFPLFSNEERAAIGTLYKQEGHQPAVALGLEYVGPKLAGWVNALRKKYGEKEIYLYCWRGGMRSGSMAWLLSTAGFVCFTMHGGYKAYRNYVLKCLKKPRPYIVLGGFTGSGKTSILEVLQQKGEQVIDLEGLAHHRGSAFGYMGAQPTSEQFTNDLFQSIYSLSAEQPIWIEDESRLIGTVYLPDELYHTKQRSLLLFINIPQAKRATYLAGMYGRENRKKLADSFQKITKRLGSERVKEALDALHQNDLAKAATLALQYYDKAYAHSLVKNRQGALVIHHCDDVVPETIAEQLISLRQSLDPALWIP